MNEFFISYSSKDKTWAEWIAWHIERAGFRTTLQVWDFSPGNNFITNIHDAIIKAATTIAVLSPNYLASTYCEAEWSAVFATDPTLKRRKLIPVRVSECTPEGLLGPAVYIDLVGLSEDEAQRRLLEGLPLQERATHSRTRPKCPTSPPFPGDGKYSHRCASPASGQSTQIIRQYCLWAQNQPLIDWNLFGSDYVVGPINLTNVIVRERSFRVGQPVGIFRAMSATSSISHIAALATEPRNAITSTMIIVLGEAGAGKTLACKAIRKHIAEHTDMLNAISLYLPLNQLIGRSSNVVDIESTSVGTYTVRDLCSAAKSRGLRVVLLADGLNEVTEEYSKRILSWMVSFAQTQPCSIVMTTRPVVLMSTIASYKEMRLFELSRWSRDQLYHFFVDSSRDDVAQQMENLPEGVCNALRLPLLAALLLRRLDRGQPVPTLRSTADVFAYVLQHFIEQERPTNPDKIRDPRTGRNG